MPNYQEGKIYTIRCKTDNNLIYVGSTTQTLAQRLGQHKRQSLCSHLRKLYEMVNNNWENWYIELYEECPCENKELLCRREGEVIRVIGSLNKEIAGRTRKEYYQDNFEKISLRNKEYDKKNEETRKEYKKKYSQDNTEKMILYRKEYRKENTEKIKDSTKIYIENNKEKIALHRKEYKEKNADKIKEQSKEYREKNKENQKEYRLINADIMKDKSKIYREKNADKIKEQKKEYYLKKKSNLIIKEDE